MRRWGKEVQGASFGGVPGEKRYRPSSRRLTVTRGSCTPDALRVWAVRALRDPQGRGTPSGGHPDVLAEQDPGVLQCGTVPLRPLLSSSRRCPIFPWLPDPQVWLVWANKGALGNQELSTPLGCRSLPALLRAILSLLLMLLSPTGCELGGSVRAAPVTSHGSAPSAAGIGVPVMRLVVTVPWKQPLLKPQYLGHLI